MNLAQLVPPTPVPPATMAPEFAYVASPNDVLAIEIGIVILLFALIGLVLFSTQLILGRLPVPPEPPKE